MACSASSSRDISFMILAKMQRSDSSERSDILISLPVILLYSVHLLMRLMKAQIWKVKPHRAGFLQQRLSRLMFFSSPTFYQSDSGSSRMVRSAKLSRMIFRIVDLPLPMLPSIEMKRGRESVCFGGIRIIQISSLLRLRSRFRRKSIKNQATKVDIPIFGALLPNRRAVTEKRYFKFKTIFTKAQFEVTIFSVHLSNYCSKKAIILFVFLFFVWDGCLMNVPDPRVRIYHLLLLLLGMDYSKDTIRCPWKLGDSIENSPHVHEPFRPIPKLIYDDVLDAIGNTPMIRINKLGKEEGIECQLLAKCEFMNMGGSVKDRIGKRMVLDAEKRGVLKPGATIVEATSGNTGIGIALASAVRDYGCIITLPEKMSAEKANVLKGLGAKVIRTPTEAAFDAADSHIGVSLKCRDEGAILLDQYCNPSNPIAHYDQLAEEILYQTEGQVDAVVIGVGTGGTIAGIARKIKERSPKTLIVGADPIGSILALPGELNVPGGAYKVEGIGYDFVPRTCARECIDFWFKTTDVPSLTYSRALVRKQGLLVGGSAGAVVDTAFRFIKSQGWEGDKTKRVVCVFSDSIRNYITKFLSKEWCIENQILPYEELKEEGNPFNGIPIAELNLPEIESYEDLTVAQAKEIFAKDGKIIAIRVGDAIDTAILPKKFLELVVLKKLSSADSALKTKTKDFVIVPNSLDVAQLSKILERHDAVIVEQRSEDKSKIEKLWVATAADLFKLIQ